MPPLLHGERVYGFAACRTRKRQERPMANRSYSNRYVRHQCGIGSPRAKTLAP
ncbi:hypothetical protein [Geminicoccus roseus]|uniref:hypothetical protein n=1 Tax=Geminicoccus roseus TaxID=404900 RepID=UPI0003F5041E|nr:hypothetical protein [Geminicoccus roseus]